MSLAKCIARSELNQIVTKFYYAILPHSYVTDTSHQYGTKAHDVASIWREESCHQHLKLCNPPSAFHLFLGRRRPAVIFGWLAPLQMNWACHCPNDLNWILNEQSGTGHDVQTTLDSGLRTLFTLTFAARLLANMTRQ